VADAPTRRDEIQCSCSTLHSTPLIDYSGISYKVSQSMSGSDTEARKELTSHFGAAVADHPDVLSECKSHPDTDIIKA
jgi:hypothetical protein